MNFTNFELRMFEAAKAEAEKSDYDRFKLGGKNGNKSHPMQRKYNRLYRKFNCTDGQYIHDSVHAEISAITSIPYVVGKDVDFSKVKIFVYRICKGKKYGYGNARPCDACMNAIRELGIKNVYYTDDDGYAYLELN